MAAADLQTTQLTFTITDNDEVDVDGAPGKPIAPTVTAESSTSLAVSWSAPANTGSDISDYDVQYQVGSSGGFTAWDHTGTGTSATIGGLTASTTYEVQVRATNDEGTGEWSDSGTGSTDAPANTAPVAVNDTDTTDEDMAVDIDVIANDTDANNDTLSVTGIDSQPSNGTAAIKLGSTTEVTYTPNQDFNGQDSFTCTVSDGSASDTGTVTVTVNDAPTVTVTVNAVNDAPTVSGSAAVDYPENGSADVASYTAADVDGTTNFTWSLSGDDASSFSISSSGTLSFGSPPNFEDPQDDDTNNAYQLTVAASDGGLSGTITVTIAVTDVDEAPGKPDDPTVAASGSDSLAVSWSAPANTGPAIIDYDYRYKVKDAADWTEVTDTTISGLAVSIMGLSASTEFEAQVRATNDEGTGAWSDSGAGTTNAASPTNTGPTAVADTASTNEDNPVDINVVANDTDPDAGDTLSVTGIATQPTNGTAAIKTLSTTEVTYTPKQDFNGADSFTYTLSDGTATDTGTVTVNPVNDPPEFATATDTRQVDENTAGGVDIGGAVSATDVDDSALTYSLDGTDAVSFSIGASSGQISTSASLDHETRPSYEVTVSVHDGKDAGGNADTTIDNTITITDVEEPGMVSFTSSQPQARTQLTATLSDPDGSVTNESWQWASSATADGTFTNLSGNGAGTASYTPQSGDVGKYLRATASYTDGHGPSKSAQAVPAYAVQGPVPAASGNLKAEPRSRLAKLTWSDPEDASINVYEYRQSTDGGASFAEDDSDWMDIPGSNAATVEHTLYDLAIGDTYTVELRAVNLAGAGASSRLTVTPKLRGIGLEFASEITSCPGNADGAGFGAEVSLDGDTRAFDILARGTNQSDGSVWLRLEYYQQGTPDTVETGWFPQECFGSDSNTDIECLDDIWPPVKGEWRFEASIDPNPLMSGDENGATVTFRAIYAVTNGDPTALSIAITGETTPSVTAGLSDYDADNLGHGSRFDGAWATTPTGAALKDTKCNVDLEAGTIICDYSVTTLFAKAKATPGAYDLAVALSPDTIAFEVTASTTEHEDFRAATARKADIDGDGQFDLNLEVIPGTPDAPTGLKATAEESSRITLEWDDPSNPGITGYEYQQTTTEPGIILRWTGSSESDVDEYEYRHTTTEPSIVITWPYSIGTQYEYRSTRTEPGITLTWDGSDDDSLTKCQYQQTTVEGDFSSASWVDIPDSAKEKANRSSFKVTGLVLDKTYYFEVRPYTDDTDQAAVPLTGQVIEGFLTPDGGWQDVPAIHDVSGNPLMASSQIIGLDLYIDHYFEVRAVLDGEPEAAVIPTQTVVNFDSATWTDIPDSGVGDEHRSSYKVTATEIPGLDLRVPHWFEVRPVASGDALLSENRESVRFRESDIINFQGAASKTISDSAPNGANALSYDVTGLSNDVTYYFRVFAVTGGGTSGPSNTASATTVLEQPAAPTGLTATPSDTITQVKLAWTASSLDEITKYQYRHSDAAGGSFADDSGWTDIPNSAPGEENGTSYTVSVANAAGPNAYEVRPFTDAGQDAVTTLELRYLGSVTLTWDDPEDSTITRYEYHATATPTIGDAETQDWTAILVSGPGTTSYTVPDLVAFGENVDGDQIEVVYTFKIRAVNRNSDDTGDQTSVESDEAKANPGLPFATPTGLTASWDPESRMITLFWDEHPYSGATQFEVTWRNAGESGGEESRLVSATRTSAATWTAIDPGASFGVCEFQIRARHNFGPWSNKTFPVSQEVYPFVDGRSASREVDARAAPGSPVGKPITATGPADFNITYTVTSSGGFVIDSAGQIRIGDTNPGQGVYNVTVTAGFNKSGSPHLDVSASINVTVTVTSMGQWRQYYKLTASDPADDDWYGSSVTVSRRDVEKTVGEEQVAEEVVVAGAPGDDTAGDSDAGAVYITIDGKGEVKLTAPTPAANEQYGYSVALQGDTLVVGSNAANGNPGKVYVYSRPADGWTATLGTPVELTAGGTNPTDGFGKAVAIDGNTIVVGAPTHNIPGQGVFPIPTPLGGIAYVFTKSEGAWGATPAANLEVEGRSAAAAMGSSVAVIGDTVLVGAPGEDKVYVFTEPSSGWADATTPAATLTGPEGSYFGASLAVDGSNLVVGAPSEGPGAAYVYSGSGSNWRQTDKLTGIGADDGDQFGLSVATSGSYIAVGRANQSDNDLAGSVQVFEKSGSQWTPYVLTARDGMANDKFGSSVALAGETLIVGATGVGNTAGSGGAGAAYVFKPVPAPSQGNAEVGRSGQDTEVRTPGVTVKIPSGARDTDYLITVNTAPAACAENGSPPQGGQVVHSCADVNLYELDGDPVVDTGITGDARVIIHLGSELIGSRFTVWKRGNRDPVEGYPDWEQVPECPDLRSEDECYDRGPGPGYGEYEIAVGGINSFSQYAVMGPPTVRPPSAPGNLAAKAGNRSVALTWTTPANRGSSAITGYEFILDAGGNWRQVPGSNADTTSYTVTGLSNNREYRFAVRARSSAGPGGRSNIVTATPQQPRSSSRRSSGGGGGGGVSYIPPSFTEGEAITRQVAENSRAGTRVGGPVTATEARGRQITYSKAGADAALFDVASQTGQILLARGVVLDFEKGRRTYTIDVVARSIVGATARTTITINVTNVAEEGSITLSPDASPEVGTAITAMLSDPDGRVRNVSIQWQRSADGVTWSDIDGATSASYTPTEDDRGTLLRPNVSYNDAAATGITLVGMASQPVPMPAVVDQPGSVTLSLEGAPEVGTVITATLTDLDGGVTGEMWQWQRSADGVTWTDIDGATAATYTATEADAGMQLRVLVTYADALGTGIRLEGAATEALPFTPELTPTPTMTPTPTPTPATTQRPPARPATPTPTAPPDTPIPTAPPDANTYGAAEGYADAHAAEGHTNADATARGDDAADTAAYR